MDLHKALPDNLILGRQGPGLAEGSSLLSASLFLLHLLLPSLFWALSSVCRAGTSPGTNSVASWQQPPLSFSNQNTHSSFVMASLTWKPRGRIQAGGYVGRGLLCWNLAEVFSPKVQCHLVPDEMVLVAGAPLPRALSSICCL